MCYLSSEQVSEGHSDEWFGLGTGLVKQKILTPQQRPRSLLVAALFRPFRSLLCRKAGI